MRELNKAIFLKKLVTYSNVMGPPLENVLSVEVFFHDQDIEQKDEHVLFCYRGSLDLHGYFREVDKKDDYKMGDTLMLVRWMHLMWEVRKQVLQSFCMI